MRAKIVVFPIKGRNWCFSRSIDPSTVASESANTPKTFKQLYDKIVSSSHVKNSQDESKIELVTDFVANKMNGGWSNLGKASEGTFKNKIHGFGVKLLSRVKPSEILFKSIPKDVNGVDVVYPPSLNPRLVRRRLRHIAFRGSVLHKKYLYGSVLLLPVTSVFMVLPLPNIAFFWILFRAYSHYRASQGSKKLLHLVTDVSHHSNEVDEKMKGSNKKSDNSNSCQLAFQPSEELQKLLHDEDKNEGIAECTISKICEKFYLSTPDVAKYKDSSSRM